MRQWISRLRYNTWPELREAWPFGLFLGGPLIAVLAGVIAVRAFGKSGAEGVLYFGTLLQVFGLLLVAVGLQALRREFGRTPVMTAMRARAVAIFRSLRRRNITLHAGTGSVGISVGGATVLGTGRVVGSDKERLDHLERAFEEFQKQAIERQQKVNGQIANVREALSKETKARLDGHAEITRKLGSVALDDHYLDVIGLCWLLFATLATSVPNEIASLWRAVWP